MAEEPNDPGWCHWHGGPSHSAVLIAVLEAGSGPGNALYACAPCRDERHLTPYAESAPPSDNAPLPSEG
ncbi:hypothetical protein [Streptomyces sp. NPDC046887]|uniref:hypothetical protein n=1 Tax=Streptomyces sp. NPDC046887 TaxID=3155472 RepID=UPI0033C439ED